MTCPYITSGCNYPEGDCSGACLTAKQHYLTIVYRITDKRQARAQLEQAEWSACSHTHAIRERDQMQAQRDELLEALKLAMPALESMRQQWPRSPHDDSVDVVEVCRSATTKAGGAA